MNSGRLWYFSQPTFSFRSFAQAGLRSPAQEITPSLCTRCSRGARHIWPKPLVVEWEPGSDVVGDFSWATLVRVAVRRAVFDTIAAHFGGVYAESVEMVQDSKLKPPKRRTSRSKSRVWLPYTGPELVELWTDHHVPFLPETTFEVAYRCKDCGHETLQLSGFEFKMYDYDIETRTAREEVTPRVPGKGVFVAASEIRDKPIFRLKEFTGPILCTDEVKSFVEEQGFTNVEFREYGDIVG